MISQSDGVFLFYVRPSKSDGWPGHCQTCGTPVHADADPASKVDQAGKWRLHPTAIVDHTHERGGGTKEHPSQSGPKQGLRRAQLPRKGKPLITYSTNLSSLGLPCLYSTWHSNLTPFFASFLGNHGTPSAFCIRVDSYDSYRMSFLF